MDVTMDMTSIRTDRNEWVHLAKGSGGDIWLLLTRDLPDSAIEALASGTTAAERTHGVLLRPTEAALLVETLEALLAVSADEARDA